MPTRARASRRRLRWPLLLRRRRTGALGRQERWSARALRPRRATAGRSSRTCRRATRQRVRRLRRRASGHGRRRELDERLRRRAGDTTSRAQTWSKLPALPTARHGVALAAIDDSLYAIGGATSPDISGRPRRRRCSTSPGRRRRHSRGPIVKWRDIREAPYKRQYAPSTEVGGRDLAVRRDRQRATSGELRNGRLRPRDQHLDEGTTASASPAPCRGGDVRGGGRGDRWVRAGRRVDLRAVRSGLCPARRWLGGAAALESSPCRGGCGGGGRQDRGGRRARRTASWWRQTEVFDGESWTDVADMPTPREHLGAASDGRYLYAVGGRELSADKNLGTLERYDPAATAGRS